MKTTLILSLLLIAQWTFAQTPESLKKLTPQLMTVLNAVDTNNDSTLSVEEVMAAPKQLATLDKNADGDIDWKEMGAWEEQLPLVRDHNITNFIDANGDIHISAEEIKNASKSLIQLDLNGDWYISKEEMFLWGINRLEKFSKRSHLFFCLFKIFLIYKTLFFNKIKIFK